MYRNRPALLLATIALSCFYADATCKGNACPQQHEAATSAGLLGGSLRATDGPNLCDGSNSYPKSGKLKPTIVPTPVVDVRWAGTDREPDKYVFALTRGPVGLMGGHLFRSEGQGKTDTWDDRTNEMTDAVGGETSEYVGVVNIHFHASHPGHMLFQGPGFHHWISNDYGRTYEPIETPGRTMGYGAEIKIHPSKPDWVLSRVQRNECLKAESASSKWCAFDLFVSQDFGRHWQNLTANSGGRVASFWDFDWGANVEQNTSASFQDETILATLYESAAHMKGPYPGWDKDMQFVSSHDFFRSSHRRLVPCGNQFEVLGGQIYLATSSDCPLNADGSKRSADAASRGSVQLLVSTDEALSFEEACIPIRFLDKGYNLVRTHDGNGAFVIVDHDEEDAVEAKAPISNIYSAGFNSTLYTLSLRRNYRRGFVTDFGRIEGLPGAYLANQLDGKIFDNPALMPSKMAYSDFVQTKVSFNGGAQWQGLTQPKIFRYPDCNSCQNSKSCQLHLHGPSSWHYGADARPSFYSHKSAPGIVMATGNTGEYLDFAADVTCTWLSADGGATWRDVLNFPGIYEFGDHGGILVMAPHQVTTSTDVVYFSLNQGGCWNRVQLEEAIDIQNIRVEPKSQSDTFIVHGQACRVSEAHPTCTHDKAGEMPGGRMYTIDITDLMASDLPQCKAGDYETWSPPSPGQCLLGRNFTLTRRKADSKCFSSYEADLESSVKACECSEADIECEFGYEWSGTDCTAVPHVEAKQCSSLQKRHYVESETHRRLIHEDQCSRIGNVIPDTNGMGVPNGGRHHGGHSGWGHFFAFLLVLGVATAAFGVWWSQFATEIQKAIIEEVVASVLTSARNFIEIASDWVREKISGVRGASPRQDAEAAYFQPLSGGEGNTLDDFGHDEGNRSPPTFH